MKKPALFIASLLLMASVCTFRMDAGTSDAGSPHGNDNPALTLAALYAAVASVQGYKGFFDAM